MCVFVPVLPDHHWKCNTKPSFLVQTNKRQLIVVLIISQNCQHIHTRALPPLKAQLHLLHTYVFSKTPNKKTLRAYYILKKNVILLQKHHHQTRNPAYYKTRTHFYVEQIKNDSLFVQFNNT